MFLLLFDPKFYFLDKMNISTCTMDEIEEEAKATAEKMVINMMQRPGQLEKVCWYIIYHSCNHPQF